MHKMWEYLRTNLTQRQSNTVILLKKHVAESLEACFTINSKHRFQIPIMGGIGVSYVKGAPFHNIFFDYGAKVRMKFYITPKFGIFVGGFYEGGVGSSKRNIPKDSDGGYKLKKTNLGMEVGVTVTLVGAVQKGAGRVMVSVLI